MKNKNIKISKNFFEKKAWQKNLYVCGIDEVGKGCLAGPIATSAVILPLNTDYELLKDSKILSEKERLTAFNWIIKNCYYTTTFSNHKKIDKYNIYQTTKKTMLKAILQMFQIIPFKENKIKYILIDAIPIIFKNFLYDINSKTKSFDKGETFSTSIAAASIVAKVTRDNIIKKISNSFPSFKFNQNKGYGTKDHLEKLFYSEKTILHRNSFIIKINKEKCGQQSIF